MSGHCWCKPGGVFLFGGVLWRGRDELSRWPLGQGGFCAALCHRGCWCWLGCSHGGAGGAKKVPGLSPAAAGGVFPVGPSPGGASSPFWPRLTEPGDAFPVPPTSSANWGHFLPLIVNFPANLRMSFFVLPLLSSIRPFAGSGDLSGPKSGPTLTLLVQICLKSLHSLAHWSSFDPNLVTLCPFG